MTTDKHRWGFPLLNHMRHLMTWGAVAARQSLDTPASSQAGSNSPSSTGLDSARASSLSAPSSRGSSFRRSLSFSNSVDRVIVAAPAVVAAYQVAVVPPLVLQAAVNGHASLIRQVATRDNVNARHPLSFCPPALGTTPLLAAVLSGDVASVEAVLACGPDINARHDVIGYTALMHAVIHCDLKMIKLLLDAGADPTVEAFDGDTAHDIAQWSAQEHAEGHSMLQLLEPPPAT